MSALLDTVLLLALPASGKSEVRRYLDHVDPQTRCDQFHMGPTVQLDDFPYVHLMMCIDEALEARGHARLYYPSRREPMLDPGDWGTLVCIINADYADLRDPPAAIDESAAAWLFARLDTASAAAGMPRRIEGLDAGARAAVAEQVEGEAGKLRDAHRSRIPDSLDGKTVVIEFARGGPEGSQMPLPAPYGYHYGLGLLSEAILERATILYIWVSPEESRRKNTVRADPNDPGSELHHGVPLSVMLGDYGCDDMAWLVETAPVPGTVAIEGPGRRFDLRIARFDNQQDRTTFLRDDPEDWDPDKLSALHDGLASCMEHLAR
jgi:hypothetical protein